MKKLKQINIAMILLLLVFQTILSPISVFASEGITNGGVTETPETTDTTSPEEPAADTGTTEPPVKTEEVINESEKPAPDAPEKPAIEENNGSGEQVGNETKDKVTDGNIKNDEELKEGSDDSEGQDPSELEIKDGTEDPAEEGKSEEETTNPPPETENACTVTDEINAVNLTQFEMKINGDPVKEGVYTTPLTQDQMADFNVTFDVLIDKIYCKGSYFEFDLPKSLIDFDGAFEGKGQADGISYSYSTTNSKVRVELTNDLTAEDVNAVPAKMTMNFKAGFNLKSDDIEQELELPSVNGGSENIKTTFTFLPVTADEEISKSATEGIPPLENGNHQIEWTVWLNTAGKNFVNPTLEDNPFLEGEPSSEDNPLEGHSIIPGSVNVFEYDVNLKGVVDKSGPGKEVLTNGDWDKIVSKLQNKHAYKIVYKTEVNLDVKDREDTKQFTNEIIFTNNGVPDPTSATKDIVYGKALEKVDVTPKGNGWNYTSKWEIRYNYNQVKISKENTKIIDKLEGIHAIDPTSLKVYKMTINEKGEGDGEGVLVDQSDYNVTFNNDGFELQFNNDIDGAYRITYDAKYNKDYYDGNGATLTNTVKNGKKESEPITHEISQSVLNKSVKEVDHDKKQITWTIHLTADNPNQAIENLELVDVFQSAEKKGEHTLVGDEKNITIKGTTGKSPIITVTTNGFTITGINVPAGETAEITYTTSFAINDNGTVQEGYGNTATVKWKDFTVVGNADYTPGTTTVNNGSKAGSFNYSNQLFTWEVKINFNKKDIAGAVLEDKIGAGHKFVKDSLQVYEYTPTTGSDTDGNRAKDPIDKSHYTLDISDDLKGYTLTFNKSLNEDVNNKAYLVVYNTVDSDDILGIGSNEEGYKAPGNVYTNTATFTTQGQTHNLVSTPVTIQEDVANNLITKRSPQQNDPEIIWTLDVNKSHSKLGDTTLTDTPSDNLILIRDSIKVREYDVSATGIKDGGAYQDPSKFGIEVEFTEKGGFKLHFEDLAKGYQVQYKTLGFGEVNGKKFSNDATLEFKGSAADNQKTESNKEEGFSFSSSESSISTSKGSAQFKKVGVDSLTGEEKPLTEIKFQLIKTINGKDYLIQSATSDKDGLFKFTKISYGDYKIKEVAAREGYDLMAPQPFTLDKEKDLDKDSTTVTKLVNTTKLEGNSCENFTITVKDIDGNPITDQAITLIDSNGIEKFSETTNKDGKVVIPNKIQAGEYTVVDSNGKPVGQGKVTVKYGKDNDDEECGAILQPENSCPQFTITLKDKDDNTRPNVAVTLKDKDGKVIISTKTDENGKLQVKPNPPAGKYYLYEGKQFLSEVNISYKDGCEIVVKQAPACPEFTLTVKDVDGKPREGVKVTIKNVDTNKTIEVKELTNSEGKVTIPKLEPGRYMVYDEKGEIKEFTVTIDCEATVQPAPSCPQFTLTVKDENGKVRPNVDNITIKDTTGAIIATNKTTNELGQITIPSENIPSGVYNVYQGDLFIGQITVKYSVNCEAEISAAPACPAFTLTVQTEFGTPNANAKITVKDANGNIVKGVDNSEVLTTSVAGTVVLPNEAIKQGTYYVYEGSRLIGSFTVKDTCSAIVKPSSTGGNGGGNGGGGGGGWTPDPEKPVDPNKPNPDPEKPVDPNKPNPDPEKPVDPNKPNPDPEKPVDPNKPNPDPEKPVDPNKPNPDPEKPVDPNKPNPDPEKPVDPNKPNPDPEKPVDPKNPGNPTTDTKNPTNPGKPETSKPSVTDVIDQGKNLPPYNPSTADKDTLDSYKDFLDNYNNLSKEEQEEVAKSLDIDKIKADAEQMEALLKATGKLPQTDGANQTALTLIGVALVLGALFLLRRRNTEVK
ncbi:collagen binding domain-containing protein [Lysinibacillus xylanilyticus]|uniref:collagen binding domain-containing protein n=1 Tax=Lysinibacillus xylanilyticus TaxID=582475 RepID=UPI003D07418D